MQVSTPRIVIALAGTALATVGVLYSTASAEVGERPTVPEIQAASGLVAGATGFAPLDGWAIACLAARPAAACRRSGPGWTPSYEEATPDDLAEFLAPLAP